MFIDVETHEAVSNQQKSQQVQPSRMIDSYHQSLNYHIEDPEMQPISATGHARRSSRGRDYRLGASAEHDIRLPLGDYRSANLEEAGGQLDADDIYLNFIQFEMD